MMATLAVAAAAAVASSSVAIRPFRAHKPSRVHLLRAAGGGLVDCVVVGGGISRLYIAQALATKHCDRVLDVVIIGARDRVNGNITTVERDGYLWKKGPNSF